MSHHLILVHLQQIVQSHRCYNVRTVRSTANVRELRTVTKAKAIQAASLTLDKSQKLWLTLFILPVVMLVS